MDVRVVVYMNRLLKLLCPDRLHSIYCSLASIKRLGQASKWAKKTGPKKLEEWIPAFLMAIYILLDTFGIFWFFFGTPVLRHWWHVPILQRSSKAVGTQPVAAQLEKLHAIYTEPRYRNLLDSWNMLMFLWHQNCFSTYQWMSNPSPGPLALPALAAAPQRAEKKGSAWARQPTGDPP